MFKLATLFTVALLLFLTLTYAAWPDPTFSSEFPAKTPHEGGEAENTEVVEESCDGVGKEECLMRRTLAAHIDYIYTQKHKP